MCVEQKDKTQGQASNVWTDKNFYSRKMLKEGVNEPQNKSVGKYCRWFFKSENIKMIFSDFLLLSYKKKEPTNEPTKLLSYHRYNISMYE